MRPGTFEEPAECKDCGLQCEAEEIITSIINEAGDIEHFCPGCGNTYIVFHRPREDRDD